MRDAVLTDEPGRLAALRRYEILDTRPEAAFDKITALVCNVLQVPMAAISLIDRDRQWFKSRRGLTMPETARSVAFCDHTIRSRDAMIIGDTARDTRFAGSPLVVGPPRIASYAGVPLANPDGYNIGSLCAIDTVPREFSQTQVDLLRNFAALVVDELEMRETVRRDFLTGALSRRAFITELRTEIERHARDPRPSALAILDLDHFKSINDRFGHPAGDRVLRAVAKACRANLRAGDSLGRLGGEEFAMLLVDASAGTALRIANRIRAAIADLELDCGTGAQRPIIVTASIGIAALDDAIRTTAEWLNAADIPLYAAKNAGRNRCVTSDELLPVRMLNS